MSVLVCQPGYEAFLAKELGAGARERGQGWLLSDARPADSCFAHYALVEEAELRGGSARQLAQALADFFLQTSRGERYEGSWPLLVEGGGEEGLAKRAHGVQELFAEQARARLSRVAKLAVPGRPARGPARGLFAVLVGPDRLFAARQGLFGGQRRMADDPQAPSRSYLKIEEAFAVLGEGPREGELVVDLGAAPGGWSYSAAKRGARVLAVDNGPLKGGALGHPLIEHRREDAFKFDARADWLLCDMVEDPERVLSLLEGWLDRGACRRFVVNLKFARKDPLPLLRRARRLNARCSLLLARHLYHDREELTLLGVRG